MQAMARMHRGDSRTGWGWLLTSEESHPEVRSIVLGSEGGCGWRTEGLELRHKPGWEVKGPFPSVSGLSLVSVSCPEE